MGIDLVELERVEGALARWGPRLVERIMGPEEAGRLPAGEDRVPAVALAIAGKEAASKALGTGWTHGVSWRQVVVLRDPPSVRLEARAAEVARRLGVARTRTTLEIRGRHALAQVRLLA